MIPWVKSKAKLACLGLCLALAQTSVAGRAANEHVTVTCEAPRIPVEVNGTQFNVFAPGYPDSFATNVMVGANGNWVLEKPTILELPLKMRGGDTASYKVTREPEDEAGGTIAFHNYYIMSNIDGGAKDIAVKSGASVTYTAYKNGRQCPSDWAVNGTTKDDTSSIIFNRSWWDVPAWFIPSMDTPKPGVYNIHAHDMDYTILADSGSMTVVGVKSISGKGKISEKDSAIDLTDAETIVVKKGGSIALTATPEPNVAWPSGTPTWSASCGFWCVLGDHFEGDTDGQATVNVDASSPDVIVVMAKCGESGKCIKVISYELGLVLSKADLTLKHDCDTKFTVVANPFSAIPTPTIQVKRNDIGEATWPDWMDLLNGSGTINWKARVAGIFKLRVKARIAGEECLSDEEDMSVQFPTFDQITPDSTVQAGMASEWQATLNDCTEVPNQRRERGFWISLETSGNGAYSCGASIQGDWVGPDDGAYISGSAWGARPDSHLVAVAPNAQSATYAVASFHTHTPTTYRANGRSSGPSDSDYFHSSFHNVAGIVYDYTISYIPAGYQKNSSADIYESRNQRSLYAD